jgi:hypothetical protein
MYIQVLALCIREGTLPQLQALNLDGAQARPSSDGDSACVVIFTINLQTQPPLHKQGGDTGLRELSLALESLAAAPTTTTALAAPTTKPLPLRSLSLAGNALKAEGVAWLGRAVTAGALPKLESLSLANNPGIGEDGHRYLAAFLRQPPPPPGLSGCKLKALDLRWTEMGVAGAQALAGAIEAGACQALERLSLTQVGETTGRVWFALS